MITGRFAPSPSGRMHLGNLFTALLAWLSVRSQGGKMLLRIEDLDPQRSKPEFRLSALLSSSAKRTGLRVGHCEPVRTLVWQSVFPWCGLGLSVSHGEADCHVDAFGHSSQGQFYDALQQFE